MDVSEVRIVVEEQQAPAEHRVEHEGDPHRELDAPVVESLTQVLLGG